MTTLDLRSLTEPQRLAAINEAVAVHCAKLERVSRKGTYICFWRDGSWCSAPHFATSADAVLPLLAKFSSFYTKYFKPDASHGDSGYLVAINLEPHGRASSMHPTFPLAACLALLRAHGVEVIQASI